MANITEEFELLDDPKYRTYVSAVDKALRSFESTSEWADLISALGKLNKVLLSHIKQPVVPRRIVISKRLAQCMHPALPGGVHLKALETYDIIFKCIGTARLSQELFIYSAGIFPLLSYAAMNVRQSLLSLYEQHFAPLARKLRPGLPGFLTGVLPGLEEGSEYYERTNNLLEKVCKGVGAEYFYACLWDCVLANPSVRLPAVTYVNGHFSRRTSTEDQLYVMGTNVEIMVQALSLAVQDQSVLVQRCTLDFLLAAFPLHSSHLLQPDMGRLVTAAVGVVLRRDMSLNRRLYSWLLGTESAATTTAPTHESSPERDVTQRVDSTTSESELDTKYFDAHSKEILIEALCSCLRGTKPSVSASASDSAILKLRPYRLLISLLDKPEIGSSILDDILLEVFRALFWQCSGVSQDCPRRNSVSGHQPNGREERNLQGELIKTANLLFGTLEPHYIWVYLSHLFERATEHEWRSGAATMTEDRVGESRVAPVGGGVPSVVELCLLTDFLLDLVSVETYVEMQTEHLPKLLRDLSRVLAATCDGIRIDAVVGLLKLCSRLLSKIQPVVVSHAHVQGRVTPVSGGESVSSLGPTAPLSTHASRDSVRGDGGTEREPLLMDSAATIVAPSDPTITSTLSPPQSTHELRTPSPELPCRPPSLVRGCVSAFQDCFVRLVKSHVLAEPTMDSQSLLHRLLVVRRAGDRERQDKLEQLLWRVLRGDDPGPTLPTTSTGGNATMGTGTTDGRSGSHVALSSNAEDFLDAFALACQILVDLSSFPASFVSSVPGQLEVTASVASGCLTAATEDDTQVPEWLRLLLVVACFVRHAEFQLTAVGTVLELMALTQSVARAGAAEAATPEKALGLFSVLIEPILEPSHLHFLHRHTIFCQAVARILWHYLDASRTANLRRCVELIHQLHNLSPDDNTVEDVIGESLGVDDESGQVRSVQKFAVLWHLTRGLAPRTSPSTGKVRALDRSLLATLDCLSKPHGPQRAEVAAWLNHSLQRGDLGAILEPILLILLHPDTARVSVGHVSIRRPSRNVAAAAALSPVDDGEARIYAISSVEGQVIYHVSSRESAPIKDSRGGSAVRGIAGVLGSPASSPSIRRLFALSSIGGEDGRRVVTENAAVRDFDLPSSCERPAPEQPMSMFVNPLVVEERWQSPEVDWNDGDGQGSSTGRGSSSGSSSTSASINLHQAHRIDVAAIRNSVNGFDDDRSVDTTQKEYDPPAAEVVADLLADLLDSVTSDDPDRVGKSETMRLPRTLSEALRRHQRQEEDGHRHSTAGCSEAEEESEGTTAVHPLHHYILLYTRCYDSGRVLFALRTLRALLQANPRLAVCAMATAGVGSARGPRQSQLYELLARHRRSMFGRDFHGVLAAEALTAFRSAMFLEVVISLCLYYARSFYPSLAPEGGSSEGGTATSRPGPEDLTANWEVQMLAVDLLTTLLAELASVVRDSGKGFALYVANLLCTCKVQKTVLHCVLSGVFLMDQHRVSTPETFTEAIIRFNEAVEAGDDGSDEANKRRQGCELQESFHVGMLRLLLVLIILEEQLVGDGKGELPSSGTTSAGGSSSERSSRDGTPTHGQSIRYQPGVLIPLQPIFQTAFLTALKQPHTSPLHHHWLGLISCGLPFLRKALATVVVSAVTQICQNLKDLSLAYENVGSNTRSPLRSESSTTKDRVGGRRVPVDHVILQLEGLTTLCHYCLLEDNSLVSTVLAHPPTSGLATRNLMAGPNATQIIGNLISVFTPSAVHRERSRAEGADGTAHRDPLTVARHNLLGLLPQLVSSLATLWKAVGHSEVLGPRQSSWIMGTPKVIQQLILELLSPISHHHGGNFLSAIAIAWNDKRRPTSKHVIPSWTEEQVLVVELVRAIKVMPIDTLIKQVRQLVKSPLLSGPKSKGKVSLEVTVLQFFFAYVQATPGAHLSQAWASLQALIKDGLQTSSFTPPGLFLLLGILNEFVQRAPPLEDRKEQKELQDLTQRLIEACGTVAAASLEQTTWLRRNLAVKPGPQTDLLEIDTDSNESNPVPSVNGDNQSITRVGDREESVLSTAIYSVQALSILAELLASLLDVVYLSDEKEKVLPPLSNLMYNVTPYLRNHCPHNVPSFRACSQLLASLSGYQYTRKVWRRDAFDLLLDLAFFQMESGCLRWWRTIIDNLMTHDKTTFNDLMARVSLAQSGGLNLFSSKEQEFEQRAQLLKRLAFVIFCSETDQYQSFMPEIQERLAECMRLPQVPSVQTNVFLCFRVLLLRMSPQHITSLWPVIITEMVTVFLQIEQELCRNSEEFSLHLRRMSTLDSSWVLSSSNGLNAHSHPAWLQLYLAVCKLLDLALCLPADRLPQFQMYRWAFVGELHLDECHENGQKGSKGSGDRRSVADFTPHVVRLARLMARKESTHGRLMQQAGRPLLTLQHIRTIDDLRPFFEAVANLSGGVCFESDSLSSDRNRSMTVPSDDPDAVIERLLDYDFLESLPTSPN